MMDVSKPVLDEPIEWQPIHRQEDDWVRRELMYRRFLLWLPMYDPPQPWLIISDA